MFLPHHQHNTLPIDSMEDTVARGVEVVLKRVFINKEFLVANKQSPQRRKTEQEEIQWEKTIETSCERDFVLSMNQRVARMTMRMNTKMAQVLIQDGSKSSWNSRIINLLLEELEKRGCEYSWPFQRSEAYLREILQHHYKRLHVIWTAAQPRVTATDGREWLEVVAWKALLGRTDHDPARQYVESRPYSIEDDRYAGSCSASRVKGHPLGTLSQKVGGVWKMRTTEVKDHRAPGDESAVVCRWKPDKVAEEQMAKITLTAKISWSEAKFVCVSRVKGQSIGNVESGSRKSLEDEYHGGERSLIFGRRKRHLSEMQSPEVEIIT
ncbi:hypothetical protein BD769DRAFT_1397103 [Suillus cothurnatus]|nr:hypothetical protein BD769DRAFT_1397103 [Suillus cothurnatus]